MTKRTTRYQGGSIVSFIIVAILIAVVLGGGLYMLRQRNEQARNQSNAPISIPNEPTVSKEDAHPTPAPSQSGNSSSTTEKENTATENTARDNAASGNGVTQGGTLPTAGPADALIIPIIAVIVYAVVAYAGSKRQLLRIQS